MKSYAFKKKKIYSTFSMKYHIFTSYAKKIDKKFYVRFETFYEGVLVVRIKLETINFYLVFILRYFVIFFTNPLLNFRKKKTIIIKFRIFLHPQMTEKIWKICKIFQKLFKVDSVTEFSTFFRVTRVGILANASSSLIGY